jgi:hypothetical protein
MSTGERVHREWNEKRDQNHIISFFEFHIQLSRSRANFKFGGTNEIHPVLLLLASHNREIVAIGVQAYT